MANAPTESRSLVFTEGTSNKFWNIQLDNSTHTVIYGRIGTSGQTQKKEFDTNELARKSFDKLVAEKLKKGYLDAGGAAPASTPPTVTAHNKKTTAETTTSAAAKKTRSKSAADSGSPRADSAAEHQTDETSPAVGTSATSPSANDAVLEVTRQIDLEPQDWLRPTFRTRTQLHRGEPTAFNKEKCLKLLSKLRTTSYGWDTRWSDLHLPPALSKEEAHFWLVATTTRRGRETSMKAFAEKIGKQEFDGSINFETAAKVTRGADRGICVETALALSCLLTTDEYLELIQRMQISDKSSHQNWGQLAHLLEGFRIYLVPYFSDQQLEEIRRKLRSSWDPDLNSTSYRDTFSPDYYVAAAIGMHDEVYQITSSWANDRYGEEGWCDHFQMPQELIFGLGSPTIIESEWRRLKLRMRSPEDVRSFLACTETAALDYLADFIVSQTNRETCEGLLKEFVRVKAPEAA
ncbi:MAG: WGR domain-containing protein [Planctomycetaceae bacterium]|nr:WGR domain-containing protein [Planctomycetaceae bacterium]